jgi:nucleoside-diphosphate-sugar epimerase
VNIGGGSRVSLREALAALEQVSGQTAEIESTASKLGDVRDTSADISKARALIDYRPTTALEDGLEAQWRWAIEATVGPGA